MEDVAFEFRLPEFGILLLALFLIYGITWLKNFIEAQLGPPPKAAAAGTAPPLDEVSDDGPENLAEAPSPEPADTP
jgi:hypothetical protein